MVPFSIATGTMDYAQNIFIRVQTDKNIYGVGECSAFPMIVGETQDTCLAMAKEFSGLWIGKDPLDIKERLLELDLFTAKNSTIKSAFDMALYDLAAKDAGKPLYQYLGGTPRKVETDITIGIDTPGHMAKQALNFVSNGARILKVKLGKNAEEDILRIKSIREAIGSGIMIRIDANQGWEPAEVKHILQELAVYNIEFCEQPLRSWYDDLLPELVATSPIAIMVDESCYNHHDARRLMKQKACNSINIKFSKSGGISEAMEIYNLATEMSVPCMIGGMLESRIALSAKLHFAYACPQINYFDLDTCLLGHLEDPCIGGAVYSNYHLSINDNPGIGADASETFLKNCELVKIC
ncbi:dipeptide epimerase [Desertivirga arenae]|uniref:dipeptide epimerase n=1 Tax=Desertivirga arenae TaxID=2810309 RepID=UPI001F61E56B|nr:dipeptide epimerase [Pedobacter sp. SYSU D00823]